MSNDHSNDLVLVKECARCYETKPIRSFKDTKGREAKRCKECRNAAVGEWPPRRRCSHCKEVKRDIRVYWPTPQGQRREALLDLLSIL